MNLQNLLSKLNDCGWSDRRIAKEVNASQPSITRLRNGKHGSTSFDRGKKIVDLARSLGIDVN